ncbi:MAG: DUF512 domain-containing protein [Eubacteriales bacterium]
MENIIIKEIEKNSIAEELGIEPGDMLLGINGLKPGDILEYRYLINDEYLLMEIQKQSGEIWQIDIEKDFDESIGLVFSQEIIDEPKSCHNQCIFCFIDQLPRGMRETLYFKDDDTRLSFLHGNYVTLTNLKDEDIHRIIKYRIQPINISVHTTNPQLRVQMLKNKKASNINLMLKKLYNNEIHMNIQIVLVPDYNDGKELENTLKDLMNLHPYVNSISVVPVGLTKYRDKLARLRTFTSQECRNTIQSIAHIQDIMKKKYNIHFVYPSDEFFIKAQVHLPHAKYYNGFSQLENGVGMMSLFWDQCIDALNHQYIGVKNKEVHIVTGLLAYKAIDQICTKVMGNYPQIKINVHPINNNFFGEEITVSGLITGRDILQQLQGIQPNSQVILPENMLRYETEQLLDDMTLEELAMALNCSVIAVKNDGSKFIEKILY